MGLFPGVLSRLWATGELPEAACSRRERSQGAQSGSAEAWSCPLCRAGFGPSEHRRIGHVGSKLKISAGLSLASDFSKASEQFLLQLC